MKIFIGADHRGYKLKQELVARLATYAWLDVGAINDERSDYPDFAAAVCSGILAGEAELGILLCGSGVGMSIAANRFAGIYAALCWQPELARMAREDDGSNILVLPADFMTAEQAESVVKSWLAAHFKGGRYQERLDRLEKNAQR